MKANIDNLRENIRPSHRKENGFFREIAALDPATGRVIISARFYWPGRDGASRCYCCTWISGNGAYGSGSGYATGGGYHKPSAALSSALAAAGVELSEPIDGRGDGIMSEAVAAVARAVTGKRKVFVHVAHP